MNFTPQQQHSLLSKMGYTGPVDSSQMENFMASNPGAAAKMGKFQRALTRGFQTGGLVPGSGVTSTTSAQKNKYSEAMGKLAKAEQEAAGWSIGGIETKEVGQFSPQLPKTIDSLKGIGGEVTNTRPRSPSPFNGLKRVPTQPTITPTPRQGRAKGGVV